MRSRKIVNGVLSIGVMLAMCAGDAFAEGASPPTTPKQAMDLWKKEGLQPIRADGLDMVYVRAAARLNGYSKVLLKPAVVLPNRDWRNAKSGSSNKAPMNLKPILAEVTDMVRAEAEAALKAGGYAVVDVAGEDVAEVSPSIVDFALVALESQSDHDNDLAARSVGKASLVVDVRDSLSGELILHAFDKEVGPEPRDVAWKDAKNWIRSTIAAWATSLRDGLDVSSGKKSVAGR